VQAVLKHFWSDEQCKPNGPSMEEEDLERRHFEGLEGEKVSNKVAPPPHPHPPLSLALTLQMPCESSLYLSISM